MRLPSSYRHMDGDGMLACELVKGVALDLYDSADESVMCSELSRLGR